MPEAAFAEFYLESLAAMGAALEPDAGLDSTLPIGLPAALAAWYRLAGRSGLNEIHNRVLAPDRLRRDGSRVIFAEESQDVVVWAFEPDGTEDPVVWQGQPVESAHRASYDWYVEEQPLSRFLMEMLGYGLDAEPEA